MEDTIRRKLERGLRPFALEIVNQSHLHAGHAGDNGSGESHFKVTVVSEAFNGKGRVERQRMIYNLLESEMNGQIHALSLKAIAQDEYNKV